AARPYLVLNAPRVTECTVKVRARNSQRSADRIHIESFPDISVDVGARPACQRLLASLACLGRAECIGDRGNDKIDHHLLDARSVRRRRARENSAQSAKHGAKKTGDSPAYDHPVRIDSVQSIQQEAAGD